MTHSSRASPIVAAGPKAGLAVTRHLLATLLAGTVAFAPLSSAFAQTHDHTMTAQTAQDTAAPAAAPASAEQPAVSYHNATIFTLRTGIADGRMVYIGVGGDIDRKVNPTLMVHEGELVQINLINGEGAEHDIVLDQYAARSSIVVGKNASSTFSFLANKLRHVLTMAGRHMSRSAVRAIIVACTRPLVDPNTLATFASVNIQEPSHVVRPYDLKR